ncbi:RDD family protein [Terribacillus sp. DMT04]|uniref:RDD family protein n=1 Tax=Terribacillus sp. DMT04 TaxID=2850441 RepID=UPI001C2C9170|nr:RDD family protein [Terribacillus sp. DMT04]QXE00912.1 RDD family protein [Terribacillus sp. DMT04]
MDKDKNVHPDERTPLDSTASQTEEQQEWIYEDRGEEEHSVHGTAVQDAPADNQRYAGFWMRFWAYLADLLVVFGLTGLLVKPFTMIESFQEATLWFWSISGLLSGLVFFAYFLFMTKWRGQTLGKMIFGIRVIRTDGQQLSWLDALIREVVGRFIHRIFFWMFIVYIVVAFTPKKQGVHDYFADTLVIHER